MAANILPMKENEPKLSAMTLPLNLQPHMQQIQTSSPVPRLSPGAPAQSIPLTPVKVTNGLSKQDQLKLAQLLPQLNQGAVSGLTQGNLLTVQQNAAGVPNLIPLRLQAINCSQNIGNLGKMNYLLHIQELYKQLENYKTEAALWKEKYESEKSEEDNSRMANQIVAMKEEIEKVRKSNEPRLQQAIIGKNHWKLQYEGMRKTWIFTLEQNKQLMITKDSLATENEQFRQQNDNLQTAKVLLEKKIEAQNRTIDGFKNYFGWSQPTKNPHFIFGASSFSDTNEQNNLYP